MSSEKEGNSEKKQSSQELRAAIRDRMRTLQKRSYIQTRTKIENTESAD